MKMQQKTRTSIWLAMVNGLLTPTIAILTTLLVGHYSAKSSRLSCHAEVSEPFVRDTAWLRTCNLELQNNGDAMLEDIKGMVQFEGQQIVAYRLKGLPALHIQDSLLANGYRLRLAFLNPMEKLAISFLLSGKPGIAQLPVMDFRARGITALTAATSNWPSMPLLLYTLLLVAAILLGVLLNRQPIVANRSNAG